MPLFHLGILCGLIFGALSVAIMLPMQFAEASRNARLIFPSICHWSLYRSDESGKNRMGNRTLSGILLSLPDAIITKAYVPIMTFGAVGGTTIGCVLARFGT